MEYYSTVKKRDLYALIWTDVKNSHFRWKETNVRRSCLLRTPILYKSFKKNLCVCTERLQGIYIYYNKKLWFLEEKIIEIGKASKSWEAQERTGQWEKPLPNGYGFFSPIQGNTAVMALPLPALPPTWLHGTKRRATHFIATKPCYVFLK